MRKSNNCDTAAIKKIVEDNVKRMEKVELTEIVEMIRPLHTFEYEELLEKELKHKARYIMRSFRDDDGVRVYFSDSEGVYINVEKSENLDDLSKIKMQLAVKYSGIYSALKKVRAKIKTITPEAKSKKKKA